MIDTTWDFDHQRAETDLTLAELGREAGLGAGDRITLDLAFVPAADDADASALAKALTSFGYLVGAPDDDGRIEASVLDIAFSADAVWLHEERTTRIALARGFESDGWGFWEP